MYSIKHSHAIRFSYNVAQKCLDTRCVRCGLRCQVTFAPLYIQTKPPTHPKIGDMQTGDTKIIIIIISFPGIHSRMLEVYRYSKVSFVNDQRDAQFL